ncbi:MAG: ABC transporter permease [Planctomycetota bacterium]
MVGPQIGDDPRPKQGWNLGADKLERLLEEANAFRGESLWQDAWRRLRANRPAFSCLVFLVAFGLLSFLAPILPLPSPVTIGLEKDLEAPGYGGFGDQEWAHRTKVTLESSEPWTPEGRASVMAQVSEETGRAATWIEGEDPLLTRFDVPFTFDDKPRVDYVETGREGSIQGVRQLGLPAGKAEYRFELPVERDEIAGWDLRTSPDRVVLHVRLKSDTANDGEKTLRYAFFLARAERNQPKEIWLNEAKVPAIGVAAEHSLDPIPSPPAVEIEGPNGAVQVSPEIAGWVTAEPGEKPIRIETFSLSFDEELAVPHLGLIAELRERWPEEGAVRVSAVEPIDAYWELGPLDRTMVGIRSSLFGLWRTGNWLGTDLKGRDLLARIVWGSRTSILVALAAALCSLAIGVTYGAFAGLVGGRVDNLMMRIVDILYSIPFIFVVIFLITIVNSNRVVLEEQLGLNREVIFFFVVGAIYWLTMARVVRGQVLSLKNAEVIEATRVMGASTLRILFVHIVPNVLSVVIVYLTLTIPAVMLFEAFLSFLGLGIEPPKVSWGLLATDSTEAISPVRNLWWLVVFPAAAMGSTLLALNILGDGLRDALDPKLRGKD